MKIGELFILGFHGKAIPEWLITFAERYGLGGVVLFDYYCQTKRYENNIESPAQVKSLCQELSSLPTNPMIFIDQEGGLVRRLKEERGFTPLPSQTEVNQISDTEKREILTLSYQEMSELGIHYNFAPVVDVNYNPQNPNIGALIGNNLMDEEGAMLQMAEYCLERLHDSVQTKQSIQRVLDRKKQFFPTASTLPTS